MRRYNFDYSMETADINIEKGQSEKCFHLLHGVLKKLFVFGRKWMNKFYEQIALLYLKICLTFGNIRKYILLSLR